MDSISGVMVTGSLMRLPLELEASETEPSLTLSLPPPASFYSSTRGWNLLALNLFLILLCSAGALYARLSGGVAPSLALP